MVILSFSFCHNQSLQHLLPVNDHDERWTNSHFLLDKLKSKTWPNTWSEHWILANCLNQTHQLFILSSSRVWPPLQPHAMCNGGKNTHRGVPLFSGVPDHHWLWFPVHHRRVSCGNCATHHSAGHHHGNGDLHHWHFPRKGICDL